MISISSLLSTTAAAVLLAISSSTINHQVEGFTDGRLLPEYLCAPPGGNMPYTLGGVLKRMVFNMDIPLAFDANTGDNVPTPVLSNDGVPDTAYMIASIHSSANSIAAKQNIVKVSALNKATPLTAGQPFPLLLDSGDPALALDGTMIWAEIPKQNSLRVGTFMDAGGVFAPFPACGMDAATGQPFGMVHMKLISDANNYTQLTFMPPATLAAGDVVVLRGLGVTDNGFGPWCQMFTVGKAGTTACAINLTTGAVMPAKKKKNANGNLVKQH